MRSDREKLLDILEAIERIERYAVQGREAFEQNELIQTWFTQTSKSSEKLPVLLLQKSEASIQIYPGQKSSECAIY